MLEKMDEFFNRRLDGYEQHQLHEIESAQTFYPFTACCLPQNDCARVLDLGCGTGLELQFYYPLNPTAQVTGIDMAEDMLRALQQRFAQHKPRLLRGSYFDLLLEEAYYDAAVSVESLHHFTQAEKIPLYQKVCRALVPGGSFVLTDYFAASDQEEEFFRRELLRLKQQQGIDDDAFYHYDTPLTVAHEVEALQKAGFCAVEILGQWGATYTIQARKEKASPRG